MSEPCVYFVATPIGNLKDITLRALDVLRAADLIFCEDTRHSLKLLSAYDIKKPLFSCHKFNEREAAEKIAAAAKEGKRVATVCKILKDGGVEYTVIPGANAALSALVLSALPADRFAFVGFLPDKAGERKSVLEKYKNLDMSLIFHVAPQDIDRHISSIYQCFGERKACAVREITKLHEEAVAFNLSEGLSGEKRGEYVVIVEGAEKTENPLNALSEKEHILHYIAGGMDKKDAVKQAAKDRGVPKSEMYKFSLEI